MNEAFKEKYLEGQKIRFEEGKSRYAWFSYGKFRSTDQPRWMQSCWGADTIDEAVALLDRPAAAELKNNPLRLIEINTVYFNVGL